MFLNILGFKKYMQNVSIVIPIYKPDRTLNEALRSLKKQKFKGKIEIIGVERGLGLAESLNYGIKKAKHDIIISLHQDCVPSSNDWLKNLVEPLKEKEVVASVSKVELPKEIWKKFSFLARLLTAKEQRVITPLLDEKGCAYKKSALIKAGLFDLKTFRTAGEDFDMYFKLKEHGEIAYPDCKVLHYHYTDFRKRLKKESQLVEAYGCLFRIYGTKMTRWHSAIIKSIPLVGAALFILTYPYLKMGIKSIAFLPISIVLNFIYTINFWSGFIKKKQTI